MNAKTIRLADDPRDTPIYSVTEAASLVGVARSTLRHWLKRPRRSRAIIETGPSELLSFYNLLEVHVLRVATERDAWLSRVRDAVEELRERHPEDKHPLISRDLYTASGYRSVFAKTIAGDIENLSKGGQLEFRTFLKQYLSRIDWDASGPYQLRPSRYRHVAINHRVGGGRPVVLDTGILVEVLARRARSGESPEEIARDYENRITPGDVKEAIRYSRAAA